MSDDLVSIRPRFRARSLSDGLLSLAVVAPCQLIGLFGIPAMIAYALTGSTTVAAAVSAALYSVFLAFTVTNLTASAEGLRFHRWLGFPKFLPWQDITSIEVASQRELILKGWLWPLFPAREMTPSLSSIGHYRISWANGFCYYPPADAAKLERQIYTHLRRKGQHKTT